MKLYQITMEPLEKRLEACIGEIKSLICSPSTDLVNSSVSQSSKVANRLLGTIYADDTHNDIDWKALLLRLYEELRQTEEKDEENEAEEDKDEYSFTLDSIGTLIVMMKDQLKKCLQSKPTTTDDNLTVDPSLRNYESISRNTNVPNYITLTQNNVEVNEIWETLVHSLKDLIIDQLVATNIDNPLQKEAFYHEMILLNSLISSSEESELFTVYNSIRSQRIEKQLLIDPVDCFNLETIVDCIKKWVNFDLEL
uniref:Uncharacterized protein n=3 Tax=Tetranychus urticae TaxID=32264 RepID=T1KCJ4_TETUR